MDVCDIWPGLEKTKASVKVLISSLSILKLFVEAQLLVVYNE